VSKFPPLDTSGLKTYSIKGRISKVTREDFARPWSAGGSLNAFLAGLPHILAGADFGGPWTGWRPPCAAAGR
jgi:hypothetical protein